jgi:predicted hotdog family 3-hydroxylacyl-ACP dehydratase
MNKDHTEILDYIPQRPPIVMIDKLVEVVDNNVVCQFEILKDNIFVENGVLLEPGIIENMAQTIAAGAGYSAKKKNEKVKLGYIAAIKNLNIYHLPLIGDILTTSVIMVNEIFNVTIVQAEVYVKKIKIAECEIRIFIEE